MAKSSRTKRIFKIIIGLVIFFTLPSLLFFGFIYFRYNEALPAGNEGKKADELALKMLSALNEEAYVNTDYLEWTFKGDHHYKWYKTKNECEVKWGEITVLLDFSNRINSKVFVAGNEYNGVEKDKYIDKAKSYFNNDSFWIFAPYKVFDPGTKRKIVKTEDGKEALLVTYTQGGTTPGDSYLWHLDDNYKPKSYQMWVEIIPIGGLEATWENWITTESGAQLSTFHKLLFFGLELEGVRGIKM